MSKDSRFDMSDTCGGRCDTLEQLTLGSGGGGGADVWGIGGRGVVRRGATRRGGS